MKVALDLHDFGVVNSRLDLLFRLKEIFPSFKVSLFTVPTEEKRDWGPSLIRDDLLMQIWPNLDWIQIIPHGYTHNASEVLEWDYRMTKGYYLPKIKEALDKDGLPFVKGFCAPHWRWNNDVVRALDDEGWWGAVDRDKIMPRTKIFYQYNFLLNEPFWESNLDILKLHGHIYGTKNDVGRCLGNLLGLPPSTEWHFVTDFLEEKR